MSDITNAAVPGTFEEAVRRSQALRADFPKNPQRYRVLTGDRAHIHHRLLGLGFSHRGAVLTLYALMVLCSAVALLTMDVP